MNTTATSLESKVRELLSGKCYSVRVSPSAEDPSLLCVRVFGVAKADMEELEDRIFDLSDELFPGGEKTLLPMIKTLEVTREHYPDVYSELCARQWTHDQRHRRRSERNTSWASAGTGSSVDDDLPATSDAGLGVPMPVAGELTRDVDQIDITLPKLELVDGVGAVSAPFNPGSVVFNREVELAKTGDPVHMTVAAIRKYYMEDLPYEPDREEMPRLFATREEVKAAGLWIEWNKNGQQKPPVADCADLLVVVECPEGVDDVVFPLSYAPDDGDPVSLAVALWTVRKTSYTRVAKPVFSALRFFLQDSLLYGRWCLTTKREKNSAGGVTTNPSFRSVGRNSEAFVAYLTEHLTEEERGKEAGRVVSGEAAQEPISDEITRQMSDYVTQLVLDKTKEEIDKLVDSLFDEDGNLRF